MRGDQQQVGQVAPSLDKRFTPSYHQVLIGQTNVRDYVERESGQLGRFTGRATAIN